MQLTRVDALLAQLEQQKNEYDLIAFGTAIADFSVAELETLSANLGRAVPSKPLTIH